MWCHLAADKSWIFIGRKCTVVISQPFQIVSFRRKMIDIFQSNINIYDAAKAVQTFFGPQDQGRVAMLQAKLRQTVRVHKLVYTTPKERP